MKKEISGITVEIFRKKTRNIIIKVNRSGEVILTVPLTSSLKEAESFFSSKLTWIKGKIEKFSEISSRRANLPKDEIYYFEGKRKVVPDFTKRDFFDDGESLFVPVKDSDKELFVKNAEKYLKKILLVKSEYYFEKWKNKTGLSPSDVSIRKTDSRWGSCNFATKKISLSLYLLNMPEFCLDYVVLHEIAHLRFPNHGKEFKSFLTCFMPNWRQVKKYMNENGELRKMKL